MTLIQRFGSGLQLDVHLHTLVLDGVFSQTRPGYLTLRPAPLPSDEDVVHVLATARTRFGWLPSPCDSGRAGPCTAAACDGRGGEPGRNGRSYPPGGTYLAP